MGLEIIKFKYLDKEDQEQFRKEFEADPLNYDEELDENQLILTEV